MDVKLLHEYIRGNATGDERRRVTEWIHESDEHLREYMAMRKLYDVTIWKADGAEASLNRRVKRFAWSSIAKVAAAAAVLLMVCYQWMGGARDEETYQTLYVPAGQRAQLTLVDGTEIWLNSQTRLTFPSDFKGEERKVKLDGEGYFLVSKNEEQPFIVETGKYDVKVLGTEFNVQAYDKDRMWETALLTGKVEVLSSGTRSGGVTLEPDTKLTWNDGKVVKSRIVNKDHYRWREGLLCFSNVSLGELFGKLERYFDIEITVNRKDILENRYTGKFWTSDGVEHVLNVLKLDNKFVYEKDDETHIITIN